MYRMLESFTKASAAIRATFSADSAPQIVAAVLKGEMPRNGTCINGWDYYVHGVGFTVVLPSGGQVHFDGSAYGDFFTIHDVTFFLETSEELDEIGLPLVRAWCETMCEQNKLRCLGDAKYSLESKLR
jgi:hypothetical protein